MNSNFGKDDEDDVLAPKEPQVTSQNPDERKAARALRIKRRQEALKRAEQPLEEICKEEEPGLIEQATTAAAEELQRLSLDGAAKVTNVKVTTDEREVIRRALFSDNTKDSLAKIEAEANEAQIKYDAISNNWDVMLAIKDPLEIDAEMKDQNQKCRELLSQKDALIDYLKEDLKQMDLAYYNDLEKQDKDIKELSERIEKQITIMQRAYEKQLFLIEQAINIERENMIQYNNKRWDALYKQRDREEMAHMKYKFEKQEEHKQEMEEIMWDHHAKYREAKIELETLIQELQKELEKLKATCIINTEKIGYNYQVLIKREEENVFVRSQQKRKLNKMSDVANALRTKIRKAAEDGAQEEIKADAEIVKLMQAMEDLEKKSRHFSHVNNYKFCQVWRMSTARCGGLARDVRHAEVSLYAQVLAQAPPPLVATPPKSPLTKYELEMTETTKAVCRVNETAVEVRDKASQEGKNELVCHILQLVADNTGFLVEDRLLKLIEKYQPMSQNLCTLDSIFMALEIQAEEDIDLLCKIFVNYAFCPVCVNFDTTSVNVEQSAVGIPREESHLGTRAERARNRSSLLRSMSASTARSTHVGFRSAEVSPSDQYLLAEAGEIMQRCGDPKGILSTEVPSEGTSAASRRTTLRGVTVAPEPARVPQIGSPTRNPFMCHLGHNLEIEPMQVLTALNEFMSIFVPPAKEELYDLLDSVKPPDFTTPSRKLTANEIDLYWGQWKDLFSIEKDRFWNGLITGLDDYLKILQERERIHEDVVQLRQRNMALRRLVRGECLETSPEKARYEQPAPALFTAPMPDTAPLGFALPQI